MTRSEKSKFLNQAKSELECVRFQIKTDLDGSPERIQELAELGASTPADRLTYDSLRQMEIVKRNNLEQLYPSPYFHKCEVKFETDDQPREILFGKFPFLDANIYSWVSPAATIRFESPGDFSYKVDRGRIQRGKLLKKDQYLIVDGKIIFLATEEISRARELVHQEYFSTRKTGFVLPEIVAQMEKAQDEVIRAGHSGPLVITGPAGSGKTTLALHRIAYLLQAPDTAAMFAPEEVIVFVQDEGTKNYFSRLLPDLGINNVKISTFGEWALDILDLDDYQFKNRFWEETGCLVKESSGDLYEQGKLAALGDQPVVCQKNIYATLKSAYGKYFNDDLKKILAEQEKRKIFDRLDLTLLLQSRKASQGRLAVVKEYYHVKKNGEMEKKQRTIELKYKLMVIDEFQNYLPQQLEIFDWCLDNLTRSSLYVGDLRQRIQLGTIKGWQQLPVKISERRLINIDKVYRNTKEILGYIKGIGYQVEIPKQLKNGPAVEEKILNLAQELSFIEEKLSGLGDFSVGIIAKNKNYLEKFQNKFGSRKNVSILTMSEVQGVEFDTVFIVGVDREQLVYSGEIIGELAREKKKIISDLLYIALTRAMTKMYIMGKDKLSEFFGDIVV